MFIIAQEKQKSTSNKILMLGSAHSFAVELYPIINSQMEGYYGVPKRYEVY
jgi:hypothetical protein